ncbi:hypothetical protein GOV04_02595 [Candidatus Woesearchaeota archaeon]|nr:hypothetical protein [Candidatus Woesearchaeota archaeon]
MNQQQGVDFFNDVNYLEPKCPKCGETLDYDVNTRFDDEHDGHVCIKCNTPVR